MKSLGRVVGKVKRVEFCGRDWVVVVDGAGKVWRGSFEKVLGEGDGEGGGVWVKAEGELRGRSVEKVGCSLDHCVAVTRDGYAAGWGKNVYGKVGEALAVGDVEEPVVIGKELGVRFTSVAVGKNHTLLVDSDGGVWGCGDDFWGQLGRTREPWKDSKGAERSKTLGRAEMIKGLPIVDARAGEGHSVLRVRDGGVVTMGFNQWSQCGQSNFATIARPARIGSIDRVRAIAAGNLHTCVVDENGDTRCCGGNEFGQLGNGTLQPSTNFKKVKGLGKVKRQNRKITALFLGNDASGVVITPPEAPSDP